MLSGRAGWRAGLVQMAIAEAEPDRNLQRALDLTAGAEAELFVLPELFSTGYALERARELAAAGPRTLEALARAARGRGVGWAGSLLHPWQGGVANAAFFVEPDGQIHALYPKVHRFRLMDEHRHLAAGSGPRVWDTSLGRIAVAVCYDLRFPVFCRRLALAGAQALVVPAEWPHPRTPHWELLLRARAVENAWWVLGVNRVGPGRGVVFEGASQAVDPWGEVAVHLGGDEGVAVVEVDPRRNGEARSRIPVFEDRVPGWDDPAPVSGSGEAPA
ncbi:nitrilase-related carbon-nitrogen hydrolase [Deferrisoma sp.]